MNLLSIPRSAALKAFALALLLPGFFCSAGRAQTMETITNSLKAYEALLANVPATQAVVYVGDMGFRPAYLSAWVSQLKAMAGLSGVAPPSAFDARVAVGPGGPASSMVDMFGGAQLINIIAGYPQPDFAHELG